MELTKEYILNKYPLLYGDKNKSMYETAMCWGLDISNGWLPLVDELSAALEKEISEYKELYPNLLCETCHCDKEDHYGFRSHSPGKCLNIKKEYLKHQWGHKHFDFRPKFLSAILTWFFAGARRIKNLINDLLFWKYESCYCEKYRHPHPRASQCKSKYGGLRLYLTHGTDKMYQLIYEAEKKSEVTCEECGQPGVIRTEGWWVCLCDECEEKRKEKKNEND